MGIWSTLTAGAAATAGLPSALGPSTVGAPSSPAVEAGLQIGGLEVVSPFAPASPQLTSILWADVFGALGKEEPITRVTGMSVPSAARARHLICGFGAKCQLVSFTGADRKPVQPRWIARTGSALTPFHRMLWTLDDLFWNGWSLWDVERERPDGPITGGATRIAAHRWSFNAETGVVLVDQEPFPEGRALLIPGPHEGLLQFGRTAILQAHQLEASATKVAQNPAAYLVLEYSGDVPQTPDQIKEARTIWAEARRGEYGGVGYTGKYLTAREMGSAAEHLLVEGRNAAAVNMARLASIPAVMVDASGASQGLQYETVSGRNAEFLDYGVDLYLDSLAARLSMDDVVPMADSVRFDTTQVRSITPSPTGPATED